ncbi:hypothetical protein [Pseudomonas rhodesiae]|uniref:hypothetical protein n=1 Tax=Pseudomonas rhodesiae TaxID=76760 RepID=UPI0021D07423|nr:hypothetical protein [Pseudomonas rhodesiae]
MSKNKSDGQMNAGVEPPASAGLAVGESVVFLDQVFTSRTLILPDGRAADVIKGRISASDDVLHNYLSKHADFKQTE